MTELICENCGNDTVAEGQTQCTECLEFDVVDSLIALDEGTLDENGDLRLFAHLIRTGMAWSLQGRIGRQARDLIEDGYITPEGEITGTSVYL